MSKKGLIVYKSLLNRGDMNIADKLILSIIHKKELSKKEKDKRGVIVPVNTFVDLTGLCERTIKGRIKYLYTKNFLEVRNSSFNFYKINTEKVRIDKTYILIPNNILKHTELTLIEKIMLALFYNYTRKNRVYYGKNSTLSKSLGITVQSVRSTIRKFKKLKIIEIKEDGLVINKNYLKEE